MVDYLVTGGAGFIGSNAVEALLGLGKSVRVFDNFSSGRRANIAPFADRIDLVEGDLRNPDDVRRAVGGVAFVLHLGAVPSVPRSVDDPLTTNEANVTGTLNLLLAARDAGVKRLVFSSSSSVYGDTPTLPKREDMATIPLSPYAASKLIGEHYCRMFTQLYGFETVVLRYFNVFGPRQDPASTYAAVVPKFIACLAQGTAPDIHGDGLQTRDFTYVANVVHANLIACEAPSEALGQVFNIACHQQITVLDLFRLIRDLVGAATVEPHHTPPRAGDVRHSFADISKAQRVLGFRPEWSLNDGLAKTVEFFTQRYKEEA
ncbi:MAG: SDR family oxidoreductase [Verrucomicrobia bacterium]|nr:SDR family oxidoreductase [Verrucomicrobiota bacterium]